MAPSLPVAAEREGGSDAAGLRVTVVCARWNPSVTDALLRSALEALRERGARASDLSVIRVPGAFELPAAVAAAMRGRPRPHAVLALGAIVRGETTHHEVLGHAVASALADLSTGIIPVGFGLLTCDTLDQAQRRTSKGAEAAEAAVEMANLRRRFGPKASNPSGPRALRARDQPAVRSGRRRR
jgi:6,7-dimethyl-8-ribityllumazine synthase